MRTNKTFVYLSDSEKAAVTRKAKEMGLSVSSLARQLLMVQINGRAVSLVTLPEEGEHEKEIRHPVNAS